MNEHKPAKSISQLIRRSLFILVLLTLAITIIAFWYLHTKIANRNALSMLELNVNDVRADVIGQSNRVLLSSAESIAMELEYENETLKDPAVRLAMEEQGFNIDSAHIHQSFLDYIAYVYDIEEINVINKLGLIVRSTNPANRYFDMHTAAQSEEFLCLLSADGPNEFVQDYTAIARDNSIFMKYAGHKLESGGFAQVGCTGEQFHNMIDSIVQAIAENRHIGNEGSVMVVREDGFVVSAPSERLKGKTFEQLGFDLEALKNNPLGKMTTQTFGRREYNVLMNDVEGYYIIGLQPTRETMMTRNVTLAMVVALESTVFLALFVILYSLVKNLVVDNIKSVADSLDKITEGNLDVVVNVKGNREFETLSNDINQTVDSLKNYAEKENARLNADLKYAHEIQHSSLPTVFPPFPSHKEFEIFASMNPAKEVGGDYYDFDIIAGRFLMFSVADVSGKGIPAALIMMKAKTMIKSFANATVKFVDMLEQVNNELCINNEAGMFVTCWLGALDTQTGVVTYVNAGHNPPLLRKADGTFEYLRGNRPNLVLGGMEGTKYQAHTFTMTSGDELFLYTDGVTEATDINGKLYGEDRLKEFLDNNIDLSCEAKCSELRKDIDVFVGDAPQFDDITMMSIKYKGFDNILTVDAKQENYDKIIDFIDAQLEKLDCPMKTIMKINVAADEAIANIISYAYGSAEGKITVAVEKCEERDGVVLRFIDKGIPFNPLDREDPDITLSAEERQIGGLGIFMIKKIMDKIEYTYENSNNLILTKYF